MQLAEACPLELRETALGGCATAPSGCSRCGIGGEMGCAGAKTARKSK